MIGPASRYDRQKRLPQIGQAGQDLLAQSSVAVIGLGALGSVTADLLARAGVGELRLIDRDVVEWSNLQRQMLYDEAQAAACLTKVEAAQERLSAINSEIRLRPYACDLSADNAHEVLHGSTLLVDGTDNFSTRYLLNDFSVKHQVPYIYAGVVGTYGMVGTILPGNGPCLRCTYPEPPASVDTPTCRSAGVLGPAVSVIAGLASAAALQALVRGVGPTAFQYLDVWTQECTKLQAAVDPACPCCAQRDFAWLRGERGAPSASPLCGGNAVQIPAMDPAPALSVLAQRLEGNVESLQSTAAFLRFTVRELDVLVFADGRALVRGTEDPGIARAVLAETLGG